MNGGKTQCLRNDCCGVTGDQGIGKTIFGGWVQSRQLELRVMQQVLEYAGKCTLIKRGKQMLGSFGRKGKIAQHHACM